MTEAEIPDETAPHHTAAGARPTPVRLRPVLEDVPAYTPGRPAQAPAGLTAYKLSSNENPYPPLPSVLEVVRDAAAHVNRYPDMAVTALTAALAAHLGVPAARVVTGPGSVGVLGQILTATCEPGDEVVFAWRSFEAYPILTRLTGAAPVMVPLAAGARHDLDAMADAVTDRTRVVLVCSPNNPTGPAVRAEEVDRLLARVPEDVLVVLDEAYLEFVTATDAPDALALHHRHPNVVVLRTFSKAYGLAGLRVGYAVAHEPVAEALRKTAIPFGVNSLAQAAGIASLQAGPELEVRVKDLLAERERVAAALADQGWDLPESQANFVWFPLGERSAEFAAACELAGLSVRPYGTDGVRVTIGEREANDRVLEVTAAFAATR
ncbi:MAG TPA: histidinol-phosphate transaminase [Dermatophilaceae bacterium]|nr:histidinol-phosphate transaminase [Dermatophilaceae bacterium]